jgi:hypothetical protein
LKENLNFPVNFHAVFHFDRDFAFRFRVIEMRDRLGNGKKSVHVRVDRLREKPLRRFECRNAVFRDERDDAALPLIDRAHVAVKYFLEIRDRFAVPAVEQRRRVAANFG